MKVKILLISLCLALVLSSCSHGVERSISSVSSTADSNVVASEDYQACNKQLNRKIFEESSISSVDPTNYDTRDDGEVWRVGSNRWNDQYEKMYSEWVKNDTDTEFMNRYQFPTDCADAGAIVRAVFSRIHHLPFMVSDGSRTIGNFTQRWSNYPTENGWSPDTWKTLLKTDLRFRMFIREVSNIVHIPAIHYNTFPVRVMSEENPKQLSRYVRPGTILMNTHHAELVKDLDRSQFDPLVKMNSTSPSKIRSLWIEPMDIEFPTTPNIGFINWRWPVNCGRAGWRFVDVESMPGYSLEQVSLKDDNEFHSSSYHNFIQLLAHDGVLPHVQKKFVMEDVKNIVARIKRRAGIVEESVVFEQTHPNAFKNKNSQEYDDYSTPAFDTSDRARYLRELSMLDSQTDQVEVTRDDFNSLLAKEWVDIGNGRKVNAFYYSMALIEDGDVSSEPSASLPERWGHRWVQNHLSILKSDLEKAQSELSQAEASYQNFVKAHPAPPLKRSDYLKTAILVGIENALNLPIMLYLPKVRAGNSAPENAVNIARSKVLWQQKQIQDIKLNYGIE